MRLKLTFMPVPFLRPPWRWFDSHLLSLLTMRTYLLFREHTSNDGTNLLFSLLVLDSMIPTRFHSLDAHSVRCIQMHEHR